MKTGPAYELDIKEPVSPATRHRSKKRAALTVSEKINIVHKVFVEKEMHAAVAKEFRVSVRIIGILCRAAHKKT